MGGCISKKKGSTYNRFQASNYIKFSKDRPESPVLSSILLQQINDLEESYQKTISQKEKKEIWKKILELGYKCTTNLDSAFYNNSHRNEIRNHIGNVLKIFEMLGARTKDNNEMCELESLE